MLNFCPYTKDFLSLSWDWLNDPEIKKMTMTPNFNREDQIKFYNEIDTRENYYIYGICFNDEKIGVCGLKNIEGQSGEYWGYIGNKMYWGCGLGSEILFFIQKLAKEKKIKVLQLKVSNENMRAISLYKKNGFFEAKKLKTYLIMEKSI